MYNVMFFYLKVSIPLESGQMVIIEIFDEVNFTAVSIPLESGQMVMIIIQLSHIIT